MRFFKRIDRKLLFYFILTTTVLLCTVTFISYKHGTRSIKNQTFSHLRFVAVYLKEEIYTFIKSQKNIARDFASDKTLIQFIDNPQSQNGASFVKGETINKSLLQNKMNLYSPLILSISILNSSGIVVASSDESKMGEDKSQSDSFVYVKNEGYFGDLTYSERYFEPIIEASAPIINRKDNSLSGVVINTISGSILENITQKNWNKNPENASKNNNQKTRYFKNTESSQGLDFNNINNEEIYIVNGHRQLITESNFFKEGILKGEIETEPVIRALSKGEEMVGIYPNYNGVQIIGASVFIPELNWVILAEKDIAKTFEPVFRLRNKLIIIVIVGLLIIIIMTIFITKNVSQPIKNLLEATTRRAKGELGFRAKKVSEDELGVLTDSFNKMCDDMDNVAVSKDYLEKIFGGISESIIIVDLDFVIRRVNSATLNILGYNNNEVVGESFAKIFKDYSLFFDNISLAELVNYGKVLTSREVVYKSKGNDNLPVSISASAIRSCRHRLHPEDCDEFKKDTTCVCCNFINIVLVARDMGAINALIQKEKERVFELTTIQEISRRLGCTLNYDDLFKIILNPLHTAINFDIAGAVFCEEPGDLVYIRQTRQLSEKFIDDYKGSLINTLIKLSGNKHKYCKKSYTDISSDKDISSSLIVSNNGEYKVKSYFNVPLIVKGEIVGVINISSFKENAFEANHIRMLYTVASQVTITIQHLITLIEQEKGKLSSILRDMVDGVIMLDLAGVVEMVNPAGAKLLKHLTILGEGDLLIHLGDFYLKKPMARILNNHEKYISQELSCQKDYEPMTISLVMSPIRGETGNIGVVIVLRDITKEHNLQQQLLHAEKLTTLGEMVSGIAHEINNPLAGVMGLAQLLQIQTSLPDGVRKNIDKIFNYADRAKRIIQNLLTFSRAHKPEKVLVNINALINETLEMQEYNLKSNNIELREKFGSDIPEVVADMYQLQQVFFNIINNAYQSLSEFDGIRELTVKTEKRDTFLLISFHNTGLGLSKDVIKKIFDPFFTTKEVGKGTGMGMSISYGIIKEHGGDIFVTSKEFDGVTFFIKFPLRTKVPGASPTKVVIPDNTEVVIPDNTENRTKKINILIVDDELVVAESICSLLNSDGHKCDIATKVEEAKEKLLSSSYDLIISDIKMPGLGGKDLYAYLQDKHPNLISRFVVVTGDVMNLDTKSFVEDHNIHFLTKPFTFDELKKVVADVSKEA